MSESNPSSSARYGQTSQSCRGPLLVALMVQTPREFGAFTHGVFALSASVKKGQRPAR
jgi:hypothetical protein